MSRKRCADKHIPVWLKGIVSISPIKIASDYRLSA